MSNHKISIWNKICVGFYKIANWLGHIFVGALAYIFGLIMIAILLATPYFVLRIGFGVSPHYSTIIMLILCLISLLIFVLVKIYLHGKSVDLGLNDLEEDLDKYTELNNESMSEMDNLYHRVADITGVKKNEKT